MTGRWQTLRISRVSEIWAAPKFKIASKDFEDKMRFYYVNVYAFLWRIHKGGKGMRALPASQKTYIIRLLSLKVRKFLEHGVGNSDYSAVCLETSLGCDHVGKLCGKVYVRHLQDSG